MPVTHGVRGSSPLRTAREDNLKELSFFLFISVALLCVREVVGNAKSRNCVPWLVRLDVVSCEPARPQSSKPLPTAALPSRYSQTRALRGRYSHNWG